LFWISHYGEENNMRIYDNKIKNKAYFLYRVVTQIFDPVRFIFGVYGYFWFIRDIFVFKLKNQKEGILTGNLFPMLHDKKDSTPFDAQYFFQQLWAFELILINKPTQHIDIGSMYQFGGYLSKIVKTVFVDIRPIETNLRNLQIRKGDILQLPFDDDSIESLSCLHVVEHIGLGRYGDKIDPDGAEKACKELARVLMPNGILYVSVPMGKDRLCFNAHRVLSASRMIRYFSSLDLKSFSYVDDNGVFHEDVKLTDYTDGHYECGMFKFTKK